ncbi:MAG TPA: N-acetyltransferase [Chloroflexi bacterium]|nr:N-acetyltransferase [Chloroflexota bacterium]
MSDLSVRPVSSEAEEQAFLRLPWTVYKDDPNWTPPLWSEHVRFFDPERNIELKHIDFEKFVAWRGDTPVGTIIAHVNHAFNEFQEVNVGWFGQFEVLEDREAADALLRTAEEWIRARGIKEIMGPATFSTNSEIGLLIEGYEHPQMILTTHARPYYRDFIEANGYQKQMDLWAWYFDGRAWSEDRGGALPEKLTRVVNKIRRRRNFTVRTVDMKHFEEEVERVKVIYNQAWAKNWGFVPMSDEEIDELAKDLKPLVDSEIAIFVEVDGKPVGFGLPLPNIYQPLRKARCKPGEPEWWQLLKLIWHWKVRRDISSVRVWALGVLEEYRGTGADALLYYEMMTRGLPRGYMDIEMSWILENNDMMNRAIKMLGGEIYKVWRVYEKPL